MTNTNPYGFPPECKWQVRERAQFMAEWSLKKFREDNGPDALMVGPQDAELFEVAEGRITEQQCYDWDLESWDDQDYQDLIDCFVAWLHELNAYEPVI